MKKTILLGLLAAVLISPCAAQPVAAQPQYQVQVVPGSLFLSGWIESAAVDRFGWIYLLETGLASGGGIIHRMRTDGSVIEQNWSTGYAGPGELAYDPVTGHVFFVNTTPVLPVILSQLHLLDPVNGPTQVAQVPVVAKGFTIDSAGRHYYGGMGLAGPGLYTPDATGGLSFVGSGLGQNEKLQALPNGDLLIADGAQVVRQDPAGGAPAPYYTAPVTLPNNPVTVEAVVAQPFNGPGAGAIIGVRDFDTFCLCGSGFAEVRDELGQSLVPSPFANESFTYPIEGLHTLASSPATELFWISSLTGFAGRTSNTWRITEDPAPNNHGSLIVQQSTAQVTLSLHGRPGGGDPFLLGARLRFGPLPAPAFYASIGFVALDPFGPGYVPVIDGLGLFGAASPLGTVPAGGTFQLSFTPPPTLPPLVTYDLQALILDGSGAPNGIVTVTNLGQLSL